jgi:hypothetical protein
LTRRRRSRLQGGTQELIKIGRFRRGGLFGKRRTGSRECVRVQRQLSGRRHGRVIIIVKVHRLFWWSRSRLSWPRGRFADWCRGLVDDFLVVLRRDRPRGRSSCCWDVIFLVLKDSRSYLAGRRRGRSRLNVRRLCHSRRWCSSNGKPKVVDLLLHLLLALLVVWCEKVIVGVW